MEKTNLKQCNLFFKCNQFIENTCKCNSNLALLLTKQAKKKKTQTDIRFVKTKIVPTYTCC